jgi:hypothetical protein
LNLFLLSSFSFFFFSHPSLVGCFFTIFLWLHTVIYRLFMNIFIYQLFSFIWEKLIINFGLPRQY